MKSKSSRYRSNLETVEERERKRLMESTNWYLDRKKSDSKKVTDSDSKCLEEIQRKKGFGGRRKDLKLIEINGEKKIMSVVFVPHTERSECSC